MLYPSKGIPFNNIISLIQIRRSIVNISSDFGLVVPGQRRYLKNNISTEQQFIKSVTYSLVKAGLIGLTRYISTGTS